MLLNQLFWCTSNLLRTLSFVPIIFHIHLILYLHRCAHACSQKYALISTIQANLQFVRNCIVVKFESHNVPCPSNITLRRYSKKLLFHQFFRCTSPICSTKSLGTIFSIGLYIITLTLFCSVIEIHKNYILKR